VLKDSGDHRRRIRITVLDRLCDEVARAAARHYRRGGSRGRNHAGQESARFFGFVHGLVCDALREDLPKAKPSGYTSKLDGSC